MRPATVDQVRSDAGWADIRPEENQIAKDLRAIDAGLRVRFSKAGKCWIISHVHHGDCPCNRAGGRDGDQYFVSSVQATQSVVSGVWTGLDERVVVKFQQINPLGRKGYDVAAELEVSRRERESKDRREREERWGELGDRTAHTLRKDLGVRYRGRAFITTKPEGI